MEPLGPAAKWPTEETRERVNVRLAAAAVTRMTLFFPQFTHTDPSPALVIPPAAHEAGSR
jgi:hypothetical protein